MVPTSSQDEALSHDGVSREVPCSALKGKTVPDSLHPSSLGVGTRVGQGSEITLFLSFSIKSSQLNSRGLSGEGCELGAALSSFRLDSSVEDDPLGRRSRSWYRDQLGRV